mmetsp:Transcript_17680/g.30938  ORF Transcript_17680/g.30938 Transcript_17680/m.30938 type:complete len:111 (-) Transcript_17680:34-366(-)|eukprot:CAMPEP_0197655466 /NCGR_PEP_ID=MMETSP1338-20131121/39469_1 /TAXON_ID=43686 ORGANISM="Pelagodinium beii, Strain RCC1491" /NCGR_SAMPLE_ID=MMETSP1338 /ASSEMBLY_ACC=CAM_ASM_000754 /LENGTH=110 /DNA_ID=CAMNT_0043231117 /DNA_START=84 /DNA_END=416 /DNA_ORIENTATION=-
MALLKLQILLLLACTRSALSGAVAKPQSVLQQPRSMAAPNLAEPEESDLLDESEAAKEPPRAEEESSRVQHGKRFQDYAIMVLLSDNFWAVGSFAVGYHIVQYMGKSKFA